MNLYKKCLRLTEFILPEGSDDYLIPAMAEWNVAGPHGFFEDYDFFRQLNLKSVYYISDIHLMHHICNDLPETVTNQEIRIYIKNIVNKMFTPEIKKSVTRGETIFLFGGDISSVFEASKTFYTEFMKVIKMLSPKEKTNYVYAVLGNHEFWDFNNMETCYKSYQELFDKVGITFLNNSMDWFGEYRNPRHLSSDISIKDHREIIKCEGEEGYNAQTRYIHNILIVGGVGFAGYNNEFNANTGIYRNAISRKEEKIATEKWYNTYKNAQTIARQRNCQLIVLTHNPIFDWQENKSIEGLCVYFNGHTHRNTLYREEERNLHIFANNQIGYKNTNILFKKAYIYNRINPFSCLDDGYYEINSNEYLQFYDYIDERMVGNGIVERLLKKGNYNFYVVKQRGYYGFFLVSKKGICVCEGGRIKKIKKKGNMCDICKDFSNMINTYIQLLSPYRNVQEQISEEVKSFGGIGTIHGCIIDIDFFNHIMLNPTDGTITYYYSPDFGIIKTYDTLIGLLNKHNKILASNYLQLLNDSSSNEFILSNKTELEQRGYIKIDIKNSLYAISNRINQLQRLFDKKVLRAWSDELLNDGNALTSDIPKLLD